tara:strand:- start:1496 stop:2815 length:1320 start_codon:yes stop_codon:yes gene_type:complete
MSDVNNPSENSNEDPNEDTKIVHLEGLGDMGDMGEMEDMEEMGNIDDTSEFQEVGGEGTDEEEGGDEGTDEEEGDEEVSDEDDEEGSDEEGDYRADEIEEQFQKEEKEDELDNENLKKYLNDYFSLKGKNDLHNIAKKRKDAAQLKNISRRFREDFNEKLKLKTNKNLRCVKCGQKGGNTFKVENNIFYGVCQAANKCFDFEIDRGVSKNIKTILKEFVDKNEKIKQEIIKIKLDILFNFISEDKGIELFSDLQEKYNKNNEIIFQITDKIKTLRQISYDNLKDDLSMKQFNVNDKYDEPYDFDKTLGDGDDIIEINDIEREGDVIRMKISSIKYKKTIRTKIEKLKKYYKEIYEKYKDPEIDPETRREHFKLSVKIYKAIHSYNEKIMKHTLDLYEVDKEEGAENANFGMAVSRVVKTKMTPENSLFYIETPIVKNNL